MRFLGNIEAKTDAKGRAFLPSAFRRVLQTAGEESLMLRKDIFQDCLVLYPQSVWNEHEDALRKRLSRWNKQQQHIFRQFVREAIEVKLDGNGRFLIPKRYLSMAEIEQDIVFIGVGNTIEIWSGQNAAEPFVDDETFSKTIEELMSDSNDTDDND
ncbi:MAG: division/cell wall cluster transcriptional repressor MraZ [Prevotella sp.]|nr:division/cell wall cluster transcriptional repressor MraZ [Prevotella sp.]